MEQKSVMSPGLASFVCRLPAQGNVVASGPRPKGAQVVRTWGAICFVNNPGRLTRHQMLTAVSAR